MRTSSLIALTLAITSTASLDAQSSIRPAASSTRIRLVPANTDWTPMVGTAVSLGADTVQIVLDGSKDTVKVLTAGLDRIERSMSRRSNLVRGILFGSLVGAAVGGAAGYALGSSNTGDEGSIAPYMIPAGIGAGALLGGVMGGIWGARSHRERWGVMPTISGERRSSPHASPAAVRLGVAARLSF